ncbi:MotA/TolQ/ExbB proton channel family protein [Halomonas aquamarina]|uniref:MotA/TolQ/ExbB proton channel family protein n=1 Tax=Vreelandella aquamarina TaxID=77097 RepID=A0ACC5VUW0_9GAMM|nr:MotA/TolQ/ExbB proton channel family protein [Halomonas aquamarina]MBZ5488030.1 MotA/TolQ/ExbB proton channel family protein [Halomonas aquamarina]
MQADIWVVLTFIPLALCSMAALALIMERCFYIFRKRGLDRQRYKDVSVALKRRRPATAISILEKNELGYQGAIEELRQHQSSSKQLRDEAVKITLMRYANLLRRRMSGLVTIAALAPMLGLLGTIVGLMRSFYDIGLSDGPVEPSIVADGLWQALSTTAAGMVIAVVCVLFHALIGSYVRRHLAEATEVMNYISHSLQLEPEAQ